MEATCPVLLYESIWQLSLLTDVFKYCFSVVSSMLTYVIHFGIVLIDSDKLIGLHVILPEVTFIDIFFFLDNVMMN